MIAKQQNPKMMSYTGKCKNQSNSPTLHKSAILQVLKDVLLKKYSSLSVNQTLSKDHVQFLHIWKPIAETEGVQGMPFLPCFHVIVTVTEANDEYDENGKQEANECRDTYILFQLHSFHGKVIADESIAFDKCDENANYNLISRMAEDRIQMCHGIEEVNKDRLINFLASCELPLLDKIKSVFLIEQFMGEIVLRSRLCEFALYDEVVYDEGISTLHNYFRCQECDAFQMERDLDSVTMNSLKPESIRCPIKEQQVIDLQEVNTYDRVFQQTSVSDGEAMAVYDKATYLYNVTRNENRSTKRAKRKTKRNVTDKTITPKNNVEVKSEPCETENNPEFMNNLQSDTNQTICDPNNISSINIKVSNEIGEDNCLTSPRKIDLDTLNKNNENLEPLQDYQYKLEVALDSSSSKIPSKRKKRDKASIHGIEDPVEKIPYTRKKHKKKELTDEEKITKLEKAEKRKFDAKKRQVTYSRRCSICSHTFTNITHFDQDQTRHAQALADLNSAFSCPLCNTIVENKFLVTEHFANAHSDLNVTCCCECSQVIPNGNNRLRRHILKFHHSAEEKVVCPECGKESSGKTQLEIHLAQYHSDKKIAVCQTCGKGFGTMSHYQLHLRRHHQPRDLQCPHCDKKFESRDQAIKHLIVHTGIKPFKCIQCQYVSYRASNVYCVHYEKSHGRKGSNEDVITDIVERDRMFEIARIEAEGMLRDRNSKLKTEPRSDSIFMRTWGRKIITKPENPENC